MEYTVIRSSRKTLALEVTRDLRLIVRAPFRVSDKKIAEFAEKHKEWAEKHLEIQKSRVDAHPMPTDKGEIELLRKQAKEYLPPRVAYYARVMGLSYTGVKITSAKKRFGSCSGKNSLCFSLYLMSYPEEAIDYVIVHELAHTVHHNHGDRFWRLVEKHMPDYRERRQMLR